MCSGRRGAPARPSTAGGRIVAHSPDAVVRPKEPSLVGAFLFRWFDDPFVEPPRASTRVWVSSASARRKSTVRKTLTSDRVLPFRHPSSSKLNSLQLPSGVWIPADFLPVGWRDTVDDATWRLTSAGDIRDPLACGGKSTPSLPSRPRSGWTGYLRRFPRGISQPATGIAAPSRH